MNGTEGVATIHLRALIQGLEVQVSVDGGSSDSFIQPRIAKFLNLVVQPTPAFKVMVGNFEVMTVEGCIPALELSIQGHKIEVPQVYVLHVAGGDLVIGTTWLRKLKSHIVDYDDSYLKFWQNGEFIALKGEKSAAPKQAQYNHIKRLMSTDAIAEAYTIQLQDSNAEKKLPLPEDMEPELALLLHTYAKVFAQPLGLPPKRTHNHCIPLITGAEPVKVKPYRYPHSQKEQIEVMVQQI